MGATYTRQASYTDGDVIQASDTNNEFDQLLAAFASSSGHTTMALLLKVDLLQKCLVHLLH